MKHFLVCYIGHYCRTFILRIVIHLPCRLLNVVLTYLFVDCITGLQTCRLLYGFKYFNSYDISSRQIRQIQAYHRKTYCDFNVTLHSRKRHFCHTKLQTIIIEVVFPKFLYLIANWTPYPKPIREALTILKSPLKLLITSSYNG